MTTSNTLTAMTTGLNKILRMVNRARMEISKSSRPTDAFPIDSVIPFFIVNPDFLEGWRDRIHPEVWCRLKPFSQPFVLTDTEDAASVHSILRERKS